VQVDFYNGLLTWQAGGRPVFPGARAVPVTFPTNFNVYFSAASGGTAQTVIISGPLTVSCAAPAPPSPPVSAATWVQNAAFSDSLTSCGNWALSYGTGVYSSTCGGSPLPPTACNSAASGAASGTLAVLWLLPLVCSSDACRTPGCAGGSLRLLNSGNSWCQTLAYLSSTSFGLSALTGTCAAFGRAGFSLSFTLSLSALSSDTSIADGVGILLLDAASLPASPTVSAWLSTVASASNNPGVIPGGVAIASYPGVQLLIDLYNNGEGIGFCVLLSNGTNKPGCVAGSYSGTTDDLSILTAVATGGYVQHRVDFYDGVTPDHAKWSLPRCHAAGPGGRPGQSASLGG